MQFFNKFCRLVFIWICFLAHFNSAKQLSNVFTSITSVTLNSEGNRAPHLRGPYSFWTVNLTWQVTEAMNAQTGDTFQLSMPGVEKVKTYFNMKLTNGKVFASCSTDDSHILNGTPVIVSCQITIDMSLYSTLSGTLSIPITFIGGGRTNLVSFAKQWKNGVNAITFNGNLKSSVTFSAPNVLPSEPYDIQRPDTRDRIFHYYLSPRDMCNGRGVKGGRFVFTVQTNLNGAGILDQSQTEYHVSSYANLNAFLYPTAYGDLSVLTHGYSNNGRTFTMTFGQIAAGKRIWFSTFFSSTTAFKESKFSVFSDLRVTCLGGRLQNMPNTISYNRVQFSVDSNGNGGKYKILTKKYIFY